MHISVKHRIDISSAFNYLLVMDITRRKKQVTITIDPAVFNRLQEWLDSQEFPPPKNAVFEAALKEWLDARKA